MYHKYTVFQALWQKYSRDIVQNKVVTLDDIKTYAGCPEIVYKSKEDRL